jgi:hypothetical protein
MGVKSTQQITREAALFRLMVSIPILPDDLLEDLLERVNDAAAGGEGFENYRILPQWMIDEQAR